jgi:hypothetical protein
VSYFSRFPRRAIVKVRLWARNERYRKTNFPFKSKPFAPKKLCASVDTHTTHTHFASLINLMSSHASSPESKSIVSFGFGKKKKKSDDSTLQSSGSFQSDLPPPSLKQSNMSKNTKSRKNLAIRQDGFGYQPDHHTSNVKISSLTYLKDESEASRAHEAAQHYSYRGTFWNEGKRVVFVRYFQLAMIGLCQGTIAYFVNYFCHVFTEVRYRFTSFFNQI